MAIAVPPSYALSGRRQQVCNSKDNDNRRHRPLPSPALTVSEEASTSCGSHPYVAEHPATVPESLLFEFDLGDEGVQPIVQVGRDSERLRSAVEQLRLHSRPTTEFQRQLLNDVQRLKRQCLREEKRHDTIVLAAKLCSIGYRVTVREAVGGGPNCLSNLRHTFLYVYPEKETPSESNKEQVVVEPHFREHFEIANACAGYLEILDAVPTEFVGGRESLFNLVCSLSHEVAHEFEVKGLMLPPWRQVKGMLSKWFPVHARDTEYDGTPSPTGSCSPDVHTGSDTERSKPRKQPSDLWLPFQYDKY